MKELERRALMGDPAAQQECTEKGIVLGCPHCGQKGEIHESETAEKTCGRKKDVPENARITRPFIIGGKKVGYFYKGKTFAIRCTKKSCRGRVCTPYKNLIDAIATWNTRTPPPIGRCKDCKSYESEGPGIGACKGLIGQVDDDFCSEFEPKEREEKC